MEDEQQTVTKVERRTVRMMYAVAAILPLKLIRLGSRVEPG
jgi:hypothetical protein